MARSFSVGSSKQFIENLKRSAVVGNYELGLQGLRGIFVLFFTCLLPTHYFLMYSREIVPMLGGRGLLKPTAKVKLFANTSMSLLML
jgi:hypothetical protein